VLALLAVPPAYARALLQRQLVWGVGDPLETLDDGRAPARVDARHLTAGFLASGGVARHEPLHEHIEALPLGELSLQY
jgi:hypothetical protein